MAEIDKTARTHNSLGNPYIASKVLDCAVDNLAQNDIANLIDVPAGSVVDWVRYEVQTVEGGARNFEIGDGSDPDGFVAATSANALGSGASGPVAMAEGTPNTLVGYSGGKYYSAADTIDLKAVTSGGLTGAKIKVSARITRLDD